MQTPSTPQPLLEIDDLVVRFKVSRHLTLQAVSGVSLQVAKGQTLGLVGESGCGKTTLARAIVGLQKITSGRILFEGQNIATFAGARQRAFRAGLQMVFQEAAASLNPGRQVGKTVAEPLRVLGRGKRRAYHLAARKMLSEVGLDARGSFRRRPFEFSLGQCQRISIARALIARPKLLVCDEPTSALDAPIQGQILNLLRTLKTRHQLTLLFISHDLAVVKNISDRIAVMYLGKLCEISPSEAVYRSPLHPYTASLLDAVSRIAAPLRSATRHRKATEFPSPVNPPAGCHFHPRCPYRQPVCQTQSPPMRQIASDRWAACHFPIEDPVAIVDPK